MATSNIVVTSDKVAIIFSQRNIDIDLFEGEFVSASELVSLYDTPCTIKTEAIDYKQSAWVFGGVSNYFEVTKKTDEIIVAFENEKKADDFIKAVRRLSERLVYGYALWCE